MLVYNGSPEVMRGRCEGSLHLIPPGEIVEIEKAFHGELLLVQLGMKGLVRVSHKDIHDGDPSEEIRGVSRAAWREFWEKQLNAFNALQIAQNKQGLPGVIPTEEMRRTQELLKREAGIDVPFEESSTKPQDIGALLVQAIRQAMAQGGPNPDVPEIADLGGATPSGPGRMRSQEAARQAKAKRAPK